MAKSMKGPANGGVWGSTASAEGSVQPIQAPRGEVRHPRKGSRATPSKPSGRQVYLSIHSFQSRVTSLTGSS